MSPGVEGGRALAPKFWEHIQDSVLDVGGTAYSCDLRWHSMGVVIGGHSFTEGVEGLTTRREGGGGHPRQLPAALLNVSCSRC